MHIKAGKAEGERTEEEQHSVHHEMRQMYKRKKIKIALKHLVL
jgi:hypothetical protein